MSASNPSHAPLDGPRLDARSGRAKMLVILLHGYGSNGDDLITLGREWSPNLPDVAFSAPDAPERCTIAPTGFQWFPLTHNPGGLRHPDEYWNGVQNAEDVLQTYIDVELEKHGLDESACALVGFSQGTMMALHVGLRRKKTLAGIIGYSGVLAGSDRLSQDILSKPPVLLVHGEADPVVPIEALPMAAQALAAVDIVNEWHVIPGLGHSIDPLGFELGAGFLKRLAT